MNILEFTSKFPDEKACKTYLKELRERQGINCKKCERVTQHWWLEKVEKFQCTECNSRTNLRSGTMMEKSKIPFRLWFMCIHLMTTTKKPFSALEMKRQLGFNRYEPVWYMMTKIRLTMGKRDEKYRLKGHIEIDDAFFEIVTLPELDNLGYKKPMEPLKSGRGSQKKMKVLIMVESTPNPKETREYKKKRSMGYCKMIVMDDLVTDGVNYEIGKFVEPSSTVYSDGARFYCQVNKIVDIHNQQVVKPEDAMKKLPWVHTVISNAKREFLGVHHSVGKEYLQSYLNEFCYKLNRRNFTHRDMFDGMLVAGSNEVWYRRAS